MLSRSILRLLRPPWFPALLLTLGCASVSLDPVPESAGPVRKGDVVKEILSPLDFSGGRLTVTHPTPLHPTLSRSTALKAEAKPGTSKPLAVLGDAVRRVASEPGRAESYVPLAGLLRRFRRPADAEAALRTALELDSTASDAARELGMLYASLGRRTEAIELFRQALMHNPKDGRAHARLAVELYYRGSYADAGDHLRRAQELGARIPERLVDDIPVRPAPARLHVGSSTGLAMEPVVRVDAGGSAQAVETAVAGNGSFLVAAWNDQRQGAANDAAWRLGAALSLNGGSSWTEGLIRAPGGNPKDFEGDPIAAYDRRTGEAWVGGVSFYQGGSVFIARRRPGAAAFDPPVTASNDPDGFFDKPLMAVGRGPSSPASTRLYITYSDGLLVSADLGQTWSDVVPMPPFEIHYQPRVGPDGVLWIVSWDMDDGIWLRRSIDGGSTVEPRRLVTARMDVWGVQESTRVPGEFRVPPLPSLAVADDGTLYVVYCDTAAVAGGNADLDLYLTHSTDGGASWSTPAPIPSPAPFSGDQFAPWLEVEPSGRLHLVFRDTGYVAQNDDDPAGWVDVTYAYSDDRGAGWRAGRVTDSSSSSADGVWLGGTVPDYQFVGDYLGLSVGLDGRPTVVYGAAFGGDFDIYSRRLSPGLFVDGFESGGLDSWSAVSTRTNR